LLRAIANKPPVSPALVPGILSPLVGEDRGEGDMKSCEHSYLKI
jgi:hypothetical protein